MLLQSVARAAVQLKPGAGGHIGGPAKGVDILPAPKIEDGESKRTSCGKPSLKTMIAAVWPLE